MGSNKKIFCLIWLLAFGQGLRADWRSDVSGFLAREDYRGMSRSLQDRFEEIPLADRTTVCGLLAYAADRSRERSRELEWIKTYYETYRGGVYVLDFLEIHWQARLVDYLQAWDRIFPTILEMGLVKTGEFSGTAPPRSLLLGLEIKNPALYKLTGDELTIEGGMFNRGFNTISIDSDGFFAESGTHSFVLETKVDDLVVTRAFDLEIEVEIPERSVQAGAISSNIEYTLSLFWGETLLVTSRKVHEDRVALKLNLPPGPDKFEPFKVPGQDDPSLHNFSIFDAIAGVTELIKNIGKDRDTATPVPPVRLQTRLDTDFVRTRPDVGTIEVKASVTLRFKDRTGSRPGNGMAQGKDPASGCQ